MFYFLPILGGQKVAMFDSANGWCAALGLFPSHYPLIYVLFPSHSLDGQKAAVSDSAQGWGTADNLRASMVSIRRDNGNGWTEDR
jgi:hypothetical protein